MAAAASSLSTQAQELVQSVAVFKLGAGLDHRPVAQLSAVRSLKSKARPFAGPERRTDGIAKRAAVRGHTSATRAAPVTAALRTPSAPKTRTKAAPAGGDEDWETF